MTAQSNILTIEQKPDRTSNPMSFASILGPSNSEPSPPTQSEPKLARKASTSEQDPAAKSWNEERTPTLPPKSMDGINGINGIVKAPESLPEPKPVQEPRIPAKPRKMLTAAETDKITKALAKIDDTPLSDVETGSFDHEHARHEQRTKKRARYLAETDGNQRKVRDTQY